MNYCWKLKIELMWEISKIMLDSEKERLYHSIRVLLKENDQLKMKNISSSEPIAIVGMACRFPGGTNTIDDYWKLLINGKDTATPIPNTRWQHSHYYHAERPKLGSIYTTNAHFIDDYDKFDADFFGITPRELESIDPQHRIIIELVQRAFENALIPLEKYYGTSTGVFIGHFTSDYGHLITKYAHDDEISAYISLGNSASTISGRVSYLFGFEGPSFPVNTACSSSLVAAHLACQSLRNKESNLAIVGGVNLILSPEIMINISQAQMLSNDGRCHTFDKSANGYGRGEGAGVVLLKRLSDAIASRDKIEAVILASGTNQDGASSALSVPNGKAQQSLLKKVLQESGLTSADIDYIEAHGTGTSLGDPIEMNAINQVYADSHDVNNPLYVSTAKTNIGHLEAAAGMAAIIKVAQCLKYKKIPPHLHLQVLNPAIQLSAVPIQIPDKVIHMNDEKPHAAGISAFGFSGSNAHIIMKESTDSHQYKNKMIRKIYITKLSAKTNDALQKIILSLIEWLNNLNDINFADLCYSLNVGRDDYAYRCIITASSVDDFKKSLHQHAIKTHSIHHLPLEWNVSNKDVAEQDMSYIEKNEFLKIKYKDVILQIKKIVPNSVIGNSNIPQFLQNFSWDYIIAEYYLWLGMKPDVIKTEGFAFFPMLAIANKISLPDAILLLIEANKLMNKEDNCYKNLVDNLSIYSGDFPVYLHNKNDVKLSLLAIFEDTHEKVLTTDEFSIIHFHDLKNQDIEYLIQCHIANAYQNQHKINWDHYEKGYEQTKIDLPNYPLQKKSYLTSLLKRMNKNTEEMIAVPFHQIVYEKASLVKSTNRTFTYCVLICDDESFIHLVKKYFEPAIAVIIVSGRNENWKCEIQKIAQSTSEIMVTIYALPLFDRSADCLKEDVEFLQTYQHFCQNKNMQHEFYYLTKNASMLSKNEIHLNSFGVRGLLKALNFEYATLSYKSIDFQDSLDLADVTSNVLNELMLNDSLETEVVYIDSARLVPRLQASQSEINHSSLINIKSDKSYVITGGLGGLGLAVCEYLMKSGAGRIHLLSRRNPDSRIQNKIDEWNKNHHVVITHAVDVSNQSQLNLCLDSISTKDCPIAGIFHLAGIDDRAAFTEYSWENFLKVFSAKMNGAKYLHEYSKNLKLDYFVMFSSIAATIGSARQAPYVMANTYLDALIFQRKLEGLPGQTIQWGPWDIEGLVNQSALNKDSKQHLLSTQSAILALDMILKNDIPHATIVESEFLQFLLRFFGESLPKFLSHLLIKADNTLESAIITKLKEAMPHQYEALIEEYLLQGFQVVTAWDVNQIDIEKSFFEMGIDSLMMIELAEFYRKDFGTFLSLSPTMLFESSNLKTLSKQISEKVSEVMNVSSNDDQSQTSETYTEQDIRKMSLAEIDAILG